MEIIEREILIQLFNAAVEAADPKLTLPPNLPTPPKGKTIVKVVVKAQLKWL